MVTSWADGRDAPGPPYKDKQFLTWDRIREVAASGLVTVVPHSDSMHEFVRSNPQGNIEPSMTTFIFDDKAGAYETEEHYRARVRADMEKTVSVFSGGLGSKPTVYTWPYSAYNSIALDEAKRAGFRVFLTVDEGLADTGRLDRVNRIYAQNMVCPAPSFKEDLKGGLVNAMPIRAVQIDLDKIVDPASAKESDARLGACLDRLASLGVNTVIVQAFCDTEGTGNVKSVYFADLGASRSDGFSEPRSQPDNGQGHAGIRLDAVPCLRDARHGGERGTPGARASRREGAAYRCVV